MAIGMSELKKGLKIEIDGIPYRITEYQHVANLSHKCYNTRLYIT